MNITKWRVAAHSPGVQRIPRFPSTEERNGKKFNFFFAFLYKSASIYKMEKKKIKKKKHLLVIPFLTIPLVLNATLVCV